MGKVKEAASSGAGAFNEQEEAKALDDAFSRKYEVYTGKKSGVDISDAPSGEKNQFVVVMPNNYDVYWQFAGKKAASSEEKYATQLTDYPGIQKGQVAFLVDLGNPARDQDINDLNFKIRDARATNLEIMTEKSLTENFVKDKFADSGNEVAFVYKKPANGFSGGEIVKAGKYFVAQSTGEKDGVQYVRMVNSSRMLSGNEFNEDNRLEAVQAKCPEGSLKKFGFNDKGRVTVGDWAGKEQAKEGEIKDDVQQARDAFFKRFNEKTPQAQEPSSIDKALQQEKKLTRSKTKDKTQSI